MSIVARRICWPDPDATCLEGGCIHCNDHPRRKMTTIWRWVQGQGTLTHRGSGDEDAAKALDWGVRHGFPNVETWSD